MPFLGLTLWKENVEHPKDKKMGGMLGYQINIAKFANIHVTILEEENHVSLW